MEDYEIKRGEYMQALHIRLIDLAYGHDLRVTLDSYLGVSVVSPSPTNPDDIRVIFDRHASRHNVDFLRETPLIEQAIKAIDKWILKQQELRHWTIKPLQPAGQNFCVSTKIYPAPAVPAGEHCYLTVYRENTYADVVWHSGEIVSSAAVAERAHIDRGDEGAITILGYVHVRGLMNIGEADIENVFGGDV
jgi:hypothetical protein